ncbi:MAG: glycosyltransferase [bacterium]|nr:glycosyltransferase [bacterium]
MKVIIQIPCFNEERTLPQTLADLPAEIPGVDELEVLVIDDGSTDRTAEVAREQGVHHVVSHHLNQGLASAFRSGIDTCLKLGADVIVNTDADNQYAGCDIPRLVAPILEGKADIVIGDRQTDSIEHFSFVKKKLQRLGGMVVRKLSKTDVPDVVSGFRAISRDAALQFNIFSFFSYTIEMIIQSGKKRLNIASVPVGVNAQTRESRLFESMPKFIEQSALTLIRTYSMYHALRVFFYIGFVFSIIGTIPIARFLYFYFRGDGGGHLQSLVLGGVLVTMGFMAFLIGLLADVIAFNRQLLERILERLRRLELTVDLGESRRNVDEPPAGP